MKSLLMAIVILVCTTGCVGETKPSSNLAVEQVDSVMTFVKNKLLIAGSMWSTYFEFTMKLEAQTEQYVTYGIEIVRCGASCGSEKYYYTFDKTDGHRVKGIITRENLVRFIDDYPEYKSMVVEAWLGMPEWEFMPHDEVIITCTGLLNDHFSLAISNVCNHYQLIELPYDQIFSYLSPEAQSLVKRRYGEKPHLQTY